MRVLIYFRTVYSIFLVTQKRQSCRARPFGVTQLCTARVHRLVSPIADQAKPTARRGCLFNYRSTTIFEDRSCGTRTHPNRVPRIPRARAGALHYAQSSLPSQRAAQLICSPVYAAVPRVPSPPMCASSVHPQAQGWAPERNAHRRRTARPASRLGGGPREGAGGRHVLYIMYPLYMTRTGLRTLLRSEHCS